MGCEREELQTSIFGIAFRFPQASFPTTACPVVIVQPEKLTLVARKVASGGGCGPELTLGPGGGCACSWWMTYSRSTGTLAHL